MWCWGDVVEASGLHATAIFHECGVFASGRHRPSQLAGAPRRLPFHPTRPPAMCLTQDANRSDCHCCHDRLLLCTSGNMLPLPFHTTPSRA